MSSCAGIDNALQRETAALDDSFARGEAASATAHQQTTDRLDAIAAALAAPLGPQTNSAATQSETADGQQHTPGPLGTATPSHREVQDLYRDARGLYAEQSRLRAEAARLRQQAADATQAGDHTRALRLFDRARELTDRAQRLQARANGLRARGIRLDLIRLAHERQDALARARDLHNQLVDALGGDAQIQQFQSDLAALDRLAAALRDRAGVDAALRRVADLLAVAQEQLTAGNAAISRLRTELEALAQQGTEVPSAVLRTAQIALAHAELERDGLLTSLTELNDQHTALLDRQSALAVEIAAGETARDRLAYVFAIADPQKLHHSPATSPHRA